MTNYITDREKYDLAVTQAFEMIRENPANFYGYHIIISLALLDADYDRAEKLLDAASDMFDDNSVYVLDKAMCLFGRHDYEGCIGYIDGMSKNPQEFSDALALLRRTSEERMSS